MRLWVREAFTYWEDPGYNWKPSRKEPRFEYLSAKRQAEIIKRSSNDGEDYLVYKGGGMKRSLGEWKHPHPIYDHCIGKFDKTISAIHMPRWACRTVLEITGVRVERVQDISEEDALAEIGARETVTLLGTQLWAKLSFMKLWESIHGPGSWDANPFVWALTFKKVESRSTNYKPRR